MNGKSKQSKATTAHTCIRACCGGRSQIREAKSGGLIIGVEAGQQSRMGHCGKWVGGLPGEGQYSAMNARCQESFPYWEVYALLLYFPKTKPRSCCKLKVSLCLGPVEQRSSTNVIEVMHPVSLVVSHSWATLRMTYDTKEGATAVARTNVRLVVVLYWYKTLR